jgi:hypothetical protein
MSWVANRKARDRRNRLKLRAELLAEGLNEQLIEKIIEQKRHEDLVARHGLEGAREVAYIEAHRQDPQRDDTGYQPSIGDPLLRGPARVGGITAKVVRRRETITKFQYDRIPKS